MEKNTMQKLVQAAQSESPARSTDFLDDLLDGKGALIVDSPQLRRALRRRATERVEEARRDLAEVKRESSMRREYGLFYGGGL
jgi:hypothetical protein